MDVSDFEAVSAAAKAAILRFKRVDCLINNAGIVSGMKLLDVPPALAAKVSRPADFTTISVVFPSACLT